MKRPPLILGIILAFAFNSYIFSQTASVLTVHDTRSENPLPGAFYREARFDFKARDVVGVPGTGYYSGLLTFAPWGDYTGNKVHQLSFNDGGLFWRTGSQGSNWESWRSLLLTDANGNVGIGTLAPIYKLDVIGGSIRTNNMFICDSYNGAQIRINSQGTYYGVIGNPAAQVWSLGYGTGGTDISPVLSWTATNNVLIGKITQSNASYKLDVAGKIRANEIVVNTTGADFVFESNYKLRSLSELETFIKANKHLPDIAPAKEMRENGVSAGEMQAKLLQKVEELTLYVIEQNKKIEALEKVNQLQNEQISKLKKETNQ